MGARAITRREEGLRGKIAPADGAIVTNVGPNSARHRFAFGEDRHRRVIGMNALGGELKEAASYMRPAEGECHGAFVGQDAIAAVSVDVQGTAGVGEMGDRSLGLAIKRIEVDDRR